MKPRYPFVIERANTNLAGFFPDLPGTAVTATAAGDLLARASKTLASHLAELERSGDRAPEPAAIDALDLRGFELEASEIELAWVEPAEINPVSLEVGEAIERAGLSGAEVARRMGVPRQVVYRLTDPFYFGHTVKSLERVSVAIGMNLIVAFSDREELGTSAGARHRGAPPE